MPKARSKEPSVKRKAISKKLRFEIFKRDSFRCQYCGASAPTVLLQVDHIVPHAEGGEATLLNLITSCEECNQGKSDRRLSDSSAIEKSKAQLDSLQQRREQLELMMEWQRGLDDIEGESVDRVAQFWTEKTNYRLSEHGRGVLGKFMKKFGVPETLDAIRTSTDRYLRVDDAGQYTRESVDLALSKVGGICELSRRCEGKPYLKELYYLRNVLLKRIRVPKPWEAIRELESAYLDGVPFHDIKNAVFQCNTWHSFMANLRELRP